MSGTRKRRQGLPTDAELEAMWRPFPAFIGPVMPPMIAWQRAGEPGWPFNDPGGPMPGTINYPKVGEQFEMAFPIRYVDHEPLE
ncbi:MAG: hypothetical protein JO255_02510 [Alphaproteobacteria bacterium]|nr:hypothetical protein [Alphaproteobacteria bacterium]